jgi:DNA adenine methylase
MTKAFLKWPGGKRLLVPHILSRCSNQDLLSIQTTPQTQNTWVEPFVGSGSVFLKTNYARYILNDLNSDLISVYRCLQTDGAYFIAACQKLFCAKYNQEKYYYHFRENFNQSNHPEERAILFVYLNRHGYNGLVRYNQSRNFLNVPFGRYEKPYFPKAEMEFFYEKLTHHRVELFCLDFKLFLKKIKTRANSNWDIYCDPPYVPCSASAKFTQYYTNAFGLPEQSYLAQWAKKTTAQKKATVLISNHDLEITRKLYADASGMDYMMVGRNISCQGSTRKRVSELLAYYWPNLKD